VDETQTEQQKAAAKKSAGAVTPTDASEAGKRSKPRKPARAKVVEEAARRYFAAISARDPDAMAACFRPDGIDDIVPLGVFRGPGEVRDLFTEFFAAIPDAEMVVQRVVADREIAAVEYRLAGTFQGGPFQGIEPTGKRIEIRGTDLVEIDDEGKIIRNTGYYDGAAFARQIGMLPRQNSQAERAMTMAFNAATGLRARLGR